MFAAVYVYGGVIDHVEIGPDVGQLKENIMQKVNGFDPSEDSVQIWDDKANIIFCYEEG